MQQKILIGLIVTLIIVVFIPTYWAMEPGRQEAARIRQQTEAVERGAKLYSSVCATCHGAQGEGIVGPALKGTQLDDDTLQKFIARGIPGTAMPAWGKEDGGPFHQQQIKDLATFIKNWDKVLSETPASLTSPQQTMPSTTETTATDGSKIFANRCSSCHGVNRQGTSGLAPALTPESLAALNDTTIKDTILNGRSGTAMPVFKGTLSPEEIDALLQFIKYTLP
ncbi:MAG: c-type cytochrome [Chloroflexi bacterium]|nr:c-type cytochrome [Chloroflexota bacterium]